MIEDIEKYASFISYLEDKIRDKKNEIKILEKTLNDAVDKMNKVIGIEQ